MVAKRPREGQANEGQSKKQKTAAARLVEVQSASGSSSQALQLSNMDGLPSSLDVEKFAEARAFEIQAMDEALQQAKDNSSHRVWQTLPRHLRRRTASHDVRRVPSRLRDKARFEMDPPKAGKKPKPSKRGKEKHVSRTESLARRQKDKTWLETHIWHAKRMHMVNVWGYRLARETTEKSYRSSLRASMHGSILHDASFIGIIELKGEEAHLIRVLERCCDPQRPGPGSVRFSSGSRLYETHLYKAGGYPTKLIAPVEILWKPLAEQCHTSGDTADAIQPPRTVRSLWVRIHPAAFQEAFSTFQEAASSTLSLLSTNSDPTPPATVEIADLRGQMNIFQLTGPKASRVISQALSISSEDNKGERLEFWKSLPGLQTAASVPRGMVIGLNVSDPRLSFPPSKNAKTSSRPFSLFPTAALAACDLWSAETRASLATPKYRKKDIDSRKQKSLAPGTKLLPKVSDQTIPVLLIQRSVGSNGASGSGTASVHGWSIIFPRGWAMAFLDSLVFTGTRVAGLRDGESQTSECAVAHYPSDFPSTLGYSQFAEARGQEVKSIWERKPPAKRPNWEVFGTRSPWKADWAVVTGVSKPEEEHAEGLIPAERDDPDLTAVTQTSWLFRGPETTPTLWKMALSPTPAVLLHSLIHDLCKKRNLAAGSTEPDVSLATALVSVRVAMLSKGVPEEHAHIYEMSDDEVSSWMQSLEHSEETAGFSPTTERAKQAASPDSIIGYVTAGGFSLFRGNGHGIGTVSLRKMVELLKQSKRLKLAENVPAIVKLRNKDSDVYRLGMLRPLDD